MNQTKHLIYEYMQNNELNLDKIMCDFEPYVRTIISNMVSDKLSYEDKEEILSDTFFVLWKNQDKVETYLEAYVAGITRNLVKEKMRKRKLTFDISEYENLVSDMEVVEDNFCNNEKLEKYISNLKKVDVQIITMFYYYSKSVKEIAKELNISEINVRTRLYRIRNKIRKELKAYGGNYGF